MTRLQEELSLHHVYNDKFAFLSAAEQYGMFETIGKEGVLSAELLSGSEDEIRFKRALILGLSSHGFLQQNENRIFLNPEYQEVLLGEKGALKFYLGMPDWFSMIQMAPDRLKQGQRPRISDETWKRIIGISSESLAKAVFPQILTSHPELSNTQLNALDLGCGKMYIFRQLALANPNLTVTGVDNNPDALTFLAEALASEQLESQISILNGDVMDVSQNLGQDYDVVLTSHLSHWLNESQTNQLFHLVHNLLRPGGLFLNYDDYMSVHGKSTKDSVRKHAILTAQGVQIFTKKEMTGMLKQAKFKKINSQVIARRRILFESFA